MNVCQLIVQLQNVGSGVIIPGKYTVGYVENSCVTIELFNSRRKFMKVKYDGKIEFTSTDLTDNSISIKKLSKYYQTARLC